MQGSSNRSQGARVMAGPLAATSLGQVMFELLDAEDSGTLLIYDAQDALHAALLFERGYPVAALADALSEHNVATLLIPMFGWDAGRFEFVAGEDLVGEHAVMRGRIDPLPLIAVAARGCMRESWIERSMGLIDRGMIQKSRRLEPGRYAFNAQERLVLGAIDAGVVELDEIRQQAQVPETVLRRVLHVLWLTRGISLLPKRMDSGTIRRSQPPRARSEPTLPAVAVPSQRPAPTASRRPPPTSYRSLPVPRDRPAPNASQRPAPNANQRPTAYSQRPTAYSQRAPAPPPSSIPPPTDPRARREHADGLWRKAEALAQRGEFDAALQAARKAVKLGEPRPEHDAMLGWLIMQHGGGDENVHVHVWRCLDRALKRDPLCEQVVYYKGLVLSLLGQVDQAQAHFQRVLLLKPGHADAQREVRIHEMRLQHARSESSFFRKLLSGRPKPE